MPCSPPGFVTKSNPDQKMAAKNVPGGSTLKWQWDAEKAPPLVPQPPRGGETAVHQMLQTTKGHLPLAPKPPH